jgi:prepilin-type processing-associated H-X9-DG protein/prepilin-type N-terminal cleavage/methylation domain-containing protein
MKTSGAATASGAMGNRRAGGFTLIELLVVIGIITLLIGLILPGLSRARDQAKTTQCLSNLRQLGMAAYTYAIDNRGLLPPAMGSANVYWDFEYTDPAKVVPGIVWGGRSNSRVQQCPSYEGRALGSNDPYTGYNYNTSYIGCGTGEVTPLGNPHASPAKLGMCRPACAIAMFGDAMSAGGTNKFMRAPVLMAGTDIGDGVSVSTRLAGTQGYRHLGRTNVCYLDGHAETVSTRFTAAAKNVGGTLVYGSVRAAAGTGFLSADDSAYGGH